MNTYWYIDAYGHAYHLVRQEELIASVSREIDPESEYYDFGSGEFKPREAMPLVVTGATISGIPENSFVTVTGPVDGQFNGITEVLSLSSDISGTYSVTVQHLERKWLPTTVEVTIS